MNRREFLAVTSFGAAAAVVPGISEFAAATDVQAKVNIFGTKLMKRPKLLFFDVNETLLDLSAMKTSVAHALDGRTDLLPLWFTTMLQYSLVATVGDNYNDFGEIGAAAMMMVAHNNGVTLSQEAAHPIPPAASGCSFSLGSVEAGWFSYSDVDELLPAGVDAQIKNAELLDMFEVRLSIEDVQLFKPHRHVYKWAARKMGLALEECMLVAAHGWDIAGALWAGWRVAFLSRPGAQLYPLAPAPEIAEPDLIAAAKRLIALEK